ncbi:MAG: flagellar basal body P-ring formation chaperone FlgA [Syntrophobacteraceae bacterium]|nr:flagellar basal body P-ring formation chaperone FlgA [Syntrophobacteraceae bacterium]
MRWVFVALLSAVFFMAPGLVPASAQTTGAPGAAEGSSPLSHIRILGSVMVRDRNVSLLQICDAASLPEKWKSILQTQDIGEAPPVGSQKFVDPAQLRSYLVTLLNSRGIKAESVKLDIPAKIIVTRESTNVSQKWVEDVFKKYVMENTAWNRSDITIDNVRFSGIPVIPTGTLTYSIRPVTPKQRLTGNVNISVDLYVDQEMVRSLDVLGHVEVFENVYFASRPLRRDDMITAADLEMHRMNVTDSINRYATLPDQVENRRVIYEVGVHQPLELRDLDKPLIIKRGDPVRIVFEAPGLMVSAKGRANGDAGFGDTVAVTNSSSTKTIYCKVVDSQTVKAVQ